MAPLSDYEAALGAYGLRLQATSYELPLLYRIVPEGLPQ
jgi:hypothetical protein